MGASNSSNETCSFPAFPFEALNDSISDLIQFLAAPTPRVVDVASDNECRVPNETSFISVAFTFNGRYFMLQQNISGAFGKFIHNTLVAAGNFISFIACAKQIFIGQGRVKKQQ